MQLPQDFRLTDPIEFVLHRMAKFELHAINLNRIAHVNRFASRRTTRAISITSKQHPDCIRQNVPIGMQSLGPYRISPQGMSDREIASGSNSFSVERRIGASASSPPIHTSSSGSNSLRNCLQGPHGATLVGETTAIRFHRLAPWLIANAAAVLSAHSVKPKEAFSILQPT